MNRKRSAQVKTSEIHDEFQKEIISFIQSLYTSDHCLDVIRLMMKHNMLPSPIHNSLEIKYKYYKFKGPQKINSDAPTFLKADLAKVLQSNMSEHFRHQNFPVSGDAGSAGLFQAPTAENSKSQSQAALMQNLSTEPLIKQRAYSLINTNNNYNYNNSANSKPSGDALGLLADSTNGGPGKSSLEKSGRKFSAQLDSHISKESSSDGHHRSKRMSLGNADFLFGFTSGQSQREKTIVKESSENNASERMPIEEATVKSEEIERKESMTQGSDSDDSMKEGLGQKGNGKNSKKGMKYHLNIDKPMVWQHFIFEKEIMTYLSKEEMSELLRVDRKELVKLKKNSMTIFHNAFKKYLKNKGKKRLLEEKINTYERNDSVFFYAHFFSKVLASREKSSERELYTEFGNFLDEQEKSDFKNINFNHKTSVKSKFTWFYQKSIWKDPWNNYNKKGQIENLKANIMEYLSLENK